MPVRCCTSRAALASRALRVVALVALSLGAAGCGDWVRTERDARPLADRALARYAAAVHLPPSAFAPPDVSTEGPHLWVFEYRSTTVPERRLVVRVAGSGRVEPSAVDVPAATPR